MMETRALVTSRGALPAPRTHTRERSGPTGQDETCWCQKIHIDPCHLQQQSRLWSFRGAKHSPRGKGTFLRLQSCWVLLGKATGPAQMDLRSPFICLSSPLAKQPFPFPPTRLCFQAKQRNPSMLSKKASQSWAALCSLSSLSAFSDHNDCRHCIPLERWGDVGTLPTNPATCSAPNA